MISKNTFPNTAQSFNSEGAYPAAFRTGRIFSPLARGFRFLKRGVRCTLLAIGKLVLPRVLIVGPSRLEWLSLRLDTIRWIALKKGMAVTAVEWPVDIPQSRAAKLDTLGQTIPGNIPKACLYPLCVELECSQFDVDDAAKTMPEIFWRWMSLGEFLRGRIAAFFRDHRPTAIVYLQGYFMDTYFARIEAIKNRVPCFALECTAFSAKIICEPVSSIAVNHTSAELFYHKHKESLQCEVVDQWMGRFAADYEDAKIRDHASGGDLLPEKRRSRVVFVAQCYTDSSLLFDARGPEMGDTVKIVRNLGAICALQEVELIVKLHPKEHGGTNPLLEPYNDLTWRLLQRQDDIRDLMARGDMLVDHANRLSTRNLLESADVCVTINSQAGLEALAMGIPVINCGQAFYSFLTGVRRVHSFDELGLLIQEIRNGNAWNVDRKQVGKFLYIYYEIFCVDKNEDALVDAIRSSMY